MFDQDYLNRVRMDYGFYFKTEKKYQLYSLRYLSNKCIYIFKKFLIYHKDVTSIFVEND